MIICISFRLLFWVNDSEIVYSLDAKGHVSLSLEEVFFEHAHHIAWQPRGKAFGWKSKEKNRFWCKRCGLICWPGHTQQDVRYVKLWTSGFDSITLLWRDVFCSEEGSTTETQNRVIENVKTKTGQVENNMKTWWKNLTICSTEHWQKCSVTHVLFLV